MDIATVLGIVVGFGLVLGSILLGGSLVSFVNIPGMLIVVGGTFAAGLIAQKMSVFMGSAKVALKAFTQPTEAPDTVIQRLGELTRLVRKSGILALENETVSDPFLAKGIRLAVDGQTADEVRSTLTQELLSLRDRHRKGQQLFRFMGATAPAMGMVGTLIGLVQMLQTMEDPSAIGPAMAVALLTTFYGAVLAFLVFIPIADKLESRTHDQTLQLQIIVEGLTCLIKQENPRLMQEKLEAFLDPKARGGEEAVSRSEAA